MCDKQMSATCKGVRGTSGGSGLAGEGGGPSLDGRCPALLAPLGSSFLVLIHIQIGPAPAHVPSKGKNHETLHGLLGEQFLKCWQPLIWESLGKHVFKFRLSVPILSLKALRGSQAPTF